MVRSNPFGTVGFLSDSRCAQKLWDGVYICMPVLCDVFIAALDSCGLVCRVHDALHPGMIPTGA